MGTLEELKRSIGQLRARFAAHHHSGQPEPMDAPGGRVYAVPAGLLDRFFDLYDRMLLDEVEGRGAAGQHRLWRVLTDRCPELRQGEWRLVVHNWTSAEVREVLP